MTNLTPSMRLKVKRDTFFLPDQNKGVYFRNNSSSFRMNGSTIDQWVEKLIPMFNGEYTLGQLTNGLQKAYRDRVYEIADVLYQNGFVRDVSQDLPHQLANQVLKKYASQIEFLESFSDSAAYRFQTYRQAKVLAIGSGPSFVSLVFALLDSGLPKFHLLINESVPTNRSRILEFEQHFRKSDPEVKLEEIHTNLARTMHWQEILQPFDSILYVSEDGDVEELRVIHQFCKEGKKLLLPALFLKKMGMAGPLIHPDYEGCWESAWRRLQPSVFANNKKQVNNISPTAGSMLANVLVFELFKKLAGCTQLEQRNQFYLLNQETLEGSWHSFIPHPMVTGGIEVKWVGDFDFNKEGEKSGNKSSELLLLFNQITSAELGIFHIWEEGDLIQLPLALCRVQAADPLAVGPSKLLPVKICAGLTHKEARLEAGLTGIEAYSSQTARVIVNTLREEGRTIHSQDFIAVAAGETFAECVSRGLQKYLEEKLKQQKTKEENVATQVKLSAIEDERCRYYLDALSTLQGEPLIGLGEKVAGFPVVWVGTNERWYSGIGTTITMALQKALQLAIVNVQLKENHYIKNDLEASSVLLEVTNPQSLIIEEFNETSQIETLQNAIHVIEQSRKKILAFEIIQESLLKEKLKIYGVLIREEE